MRAGAFHAALAVGFVACGAACGGGGGGTVEVPPSSPYERPPTSSDTPPGTYERPGSGDQDPYGGGCVPCDRELTCSFMLGNSGGISGAALRSIGGVCVLAESGLGYTGVALLCDGSIVSQQTGTTEGSWSRTSTEGLMFCPSVGQGDVCITCTFGGSFDGGGQDASPTPLPPAGGQPGFSASDGGSTLD